MVYRTPETYPSFSEECRTCATTSLTCSDLCEDYYLIEMSHTDQRPFLGWLNTYAFLTDGKEAHPDLGPLGWVSSAQADGSMVSCATRNAASWLLNWEEDLEVVAGWTDALDEEPTYREVVKQLVTSTEYWGGTP